MAGAVANVHGGGYGQAGRFEANIATREPRWVKVLILTVGLGFFALFLLLPLVAVFLEAFRKGWHVYLASLTEPDALSAVRLTLLAAAIAVPLLGERVSARHWLFVLLGFAGVVVVLRPAPEVFGWAVLLPLGSAASYAAYQVMTKRAAVLDPAVPSLFYSSLVGCLIAACVAPFVWTWPTPLHAAIMLVHGALCGLSHFLVIKSLMLSPVSLSAPFGYAGLIWAVLLGMVLFGEIPDLATLAGGALIAFAGILLAREAVRRGRHGG